MAGGQKSAEHVTPKPTTGKNSTCRGAGKGPEQNGQEYGISS